VNGLKDLFLLGGIHTDALQCFSDTAVGTDECFIIIPAECRSALIRQSALRAYAL